MTPTPNEPPRVIDEATLRDIEKECRDAKWIAERRRDQAIVALRDAEAAEERARLLPAVRSFLAARIGMTLEQALAEAEAELAKADAEVIERAQAVERAKAWLRDLEGWRRIQQKLIDEKRAQLEAESEPAPEED